MNDIEASSSAADSPGARAQALPNKPIVLIGMRGAGKTSVGKVLARRIERPFLDLDHETLRRARESGVRAGSVAQLLSDQGQAAFRGFEASALRRICEPSLRVVLAAGGGVVERTDARSWLQRSAFTIWLDAPLELLRQRVSADGVESRPSLTGADPVEELEGVLARRAPLYAQVADAVVAVADLDLGQAAAAVLVAAERAAD